MKHLLFLISFCLTTGIAYSAGHIHYSVESTSESTVNLLFQVNKPENHPLDALFLAVASNETNSVKGTGAFITHGQSATPLVSAIVEEGWQGGHYMQWVKIELPDHLHTQKQYTGTVHLHSGSFTEYNNDNIMIRNSVVYLPSTSPISKRSRVEIPPVPYTRGVKIEVDRDGIYQFSTNDLLGLGVPVSTVPARNFRLFNKGVEVPIHTTVSNSTYFRSGDKILFYGRHLRAEHSYFTQYSNTNIYWLSWGDTPGKRYMEVSGAQRRDLTEYGTRFDTSATIAREFYDTLHFEQDNDIRWLGSIHDPSEMSGAPVIDTIDNWYWGFIGTDDLTNHTIDLPSPAGRGSAQITIAMMGLTSIPYEPMDHSFSILVNGNSPGTNNQARWNGQTSHLFVSDTFPVTLLTEGTNTISFLKEQRGFTDRAALNWIRIAYPRIYRALDNTLSFRNNESSFFTVVQYELSSFTSGSVDLWDINKNRIFTQMQINESVRNNRTVYSVIFQDSVNTSTSYFAQAQQKRITPSMSLETIASSWDTLMGADYIAISVDSFKTTLEPLLETHRSRGLRSVFVDIDDIYNSFSFGIRNPESIRRFLKYLFSLSPHNPPRYLLLGGDTTHDIDKKNQDRNIIPTYLSRTPGWGPSSNDGYFVTVRGDNNFPDMFVGRFPAQNRTEMETMVNKTVNYINAPTKGFWRDNILLAGGGRPNEPQFRLFNDEVSSEVIGARRNILRMDADPNSPWYKSEFNSTRTMADFINAGLHILNFNGHGGGNVWSDSRFFSYNDLHLLHNGSWNTGGKLPIVFSFTCLTGFFESTFYRSLGEEFVRSGVNGSIAFYGASAYTTRGGNLKKNRLLLEQGLGGSFESLGELLNHVETLMLVQHGQEHLPLIRQYNLLGDPALPWLTVADTMELTINKNILTGNDTLIVSGNTGPVSEGKVLIQVLSGNQEWERRIVDVKDAIFEESFSLKEDAVTSDGVIRAYAWNNTDEIRGHTPFSKDIFMVYDLHIDPPQPALGESVTVRCRADVPPETPDALLYCLYTTAPRHQEQISVQGVLMEKDSNGIYTSVSKIPVELSEDPAAVLQLRFRIIAGSDSKESSRFVFPVVGRPDLMFTKDSISLFWTGDSMAISFEVLNVGNTSSPPYTVDINWVETPQSVSALGQLTSPDSLLPGSTHRFEISFPDTSGSFSIEALINSGEDLAESRFDNNRAVLDFAIISDTLRLPSDTVESYGKGLGLSPFEELNSRHRVFIFSRDLGNTQPLRTTSQWIALGKDSLSSFHLGIRPPLAEGDTLLWSLRPQQSTGAPGSQNQTLSPSVMQFDSVANVWRYAGSPAENSDAIEFKSAGSGPYSLAFLNDNTPPQIRLTVAGRELNFLDYVAKDRPFNVIISDPSGINSSSVELWLNNEELSEGSHSALNAAETPEHLNVTVYPTSQRSIDSLTVVAADLAGNVNEVTFAYMPGEDLKIKFFACHPNPFTAQTYPDGTSQQIRFAFLLTDLSDVELTLYTASGRNINNWRYSDLIGYQEIEWNGRDRNGYRLANGTYFAKLTAKSRRATVQKIIPLAKLEGYR